MNGSKKAMKCAPGSSLTSATTAGLSVSRSCRHRRLSRTLENSSSPSVNPQSESPRSGGRREMNPRRATGGWAWLWVLVLCAAGCSGGQAGIPPQSVETNQFQEMRGGVRVSVDPYFAKDRIVQTFSAGERFAESGVLPIQLTIENGSGGEVKVSPRDFRLIGPNSGGDAPLTAQDAFSLVKIRIQYWALIPIIGTSVTAARNSPVFKDLESRELREATIPPGGQTTGFLYFRIAEEQKNLAGFLVAAFVGRPSGQNMTYVVPIEGRRDIPVPPKPSEKPGTAAPPAPTPQNPARVEGADGGIIIRSP